jgi:hypothetical protein
MKESKTMGPAAMSFFVFGVYMTVLGIALMLAPNPLLGLVGIAETTDVWVRVVGVLVIVIGILDVLGGVGTQGRRGHDNPLEAGLFRSLAMHTAKSDEEMRT